MTKLFKYEGFRVVISEEALLLKPFKLIWNRDRNPSKAKALMELGFVYFFADPRSDYQIYIDEDKRIEEIKKGEGFKKEWKPDKLVSEAIELYKSFKPASALLLEDTRVVVDKMRATLRNIEFESLEVKELKELSQLVRQVASLIKELDEAERALNSEIISNSRIRGNAEKTLMDDGFEL